MCAPAPPARSHSISEGGAPASRGGTPLTDRLYRNLKDYITMDELNVEIHMVKENEILSRSSRSAQKFMHGIRVLMAKNYIDNLSEEVKKGLHTKAAQSLWPSFAPPGYRNAAGEGGKRIIVPDPVLGPIVARLFEWFATGEYSLKTLAKKAYQEGFRFRKSGNKIPVATLHKILRDWSNADSRGKRNEI